MANNINQTYPTATGVSAPAVELEMSGNTSASTKSSGLNYDPTIPQPISPDANKGKRHEQYIKGQSEYPR